jgi:hypothetical protein
MKPTVSLMVLTLLLLTTSLAGLWFVSSASANPDGEFPQLSMPVEHINYTITEINGTLWAKIDGNYPITILNQRNCYELPMVYPMPPQTTNINLTLNGQELEWSNYTQTYPELLHRTAIGNWSMISSVLENVSDSFLLEIHYEHPLQVVNGSYLFLYDLNILDYLSVLGPTSIAYFTIRFETNVSDVRAYTAPVDSLASEWRAINFKISDEDSFAFMSVEMRSKYSTPLPGDLVVVFSQENDQSIWIWPVIIDVVLIAIVIFVKRKSIVSVFSSRKSAV